MAVATVDAIVHHVVFVAEWHWLIDGSANVRDVRRPHVQLEDGEQEDEPEQRTPQREPSQAVRTWAENLSHCALSV
jgi:hypothetical protein